MSSIIKIALAVVILGAIAGVSIYFYMSGGSYALLREAENLYTAGDLNGAYKKADEALLADPKNQKAIDLKSKLYSEVQDDTNYKKAGEEYNLGMNELNRQNYQAAGSHLYNAIGHIDNISEKAPQYVQAQALRKEALTRYNELVISPTEYYYNSALKAYGSEDYARALEYLRQVPRETPQVTNLRSDIVYDLGMKRHQEIIANPSLYPAAYYNDAINWLNQVNSSSPHYRQSQEAIRTLMEKMPKK